MIKTKGSFANGREMMKSYRAAAKKGITQLDRKERKNEILTVKEKGELEALKKSVPVYSLSQTLPAKYEGLIVNSKLLDRFFKHLKDMNWELHVTDNVLILRYFKNGNEGILRLYDLTPYFEEFNDIPEMEIKQ